MTPAYTSDTRRPKPSTLTNYSKLPPALFSPLSEQNKNDAYHAALNSLFYSLHQQMLYAPVD